MWIVARGGLLFDDEVARRSAAFQRVTLAYLTVGHIVSDSPFDVNSRFLYSYSFICLLGRMGG